MNHKKIHKILCRSASFDNAKQHVMKFFTQSMLLNYDVLTVDLALSCQATSSQFWQDVDDSILENRRVLASYIAELRESGCETLADIEKVKVGYQSKLVHLIAHLVDGFIGIDSFFYCLPEDSHWLSGNLRKNIEQNQDEFWLLHVEASFLSIDSASLVHHD